MPKRGLSLDYERPFVTIYLNDPAITREMHRRTELCVPVLPVRMPLSSNDDEVGQAPTRSLATSWPGWRADPLPETPAVAETMAR